MRKILAFFHALLATVLLTCGVAAFAATSILPSSGDAAEAQVAMDPFGRETPRSTVTNLLGVLASEDPGALDPYLDLPAGMDRAEVVPRLRAALDAWMVQQGDKGMETELIAKTRQGPRQQKNAAAKKNTKKKKKLP